MSTMTLAKGARMSPTERIREIPDTLGRLEAAADLVHDTEKRADAAREIRDMAAIVAHIDHGVAPVTLYREVLECSRGLFVRIIQRAPAVRPQIDDALDQARASAAAVRRHEAVIEEARLIRDTTALLLMNGGKDPVTGEKVKAVSNAQIAKVTGLSTARIAQVRTGTR